MGIIDSKAYEAITFAKKVENLFLETSGFHTPRLIRKAVRVIGCEKVLFGSDTPFQPLRYEMDKILRYSDLSDKDLEYRSILSVIVAVGVTFIMIF